MSLSRKAINFDLSTNELKKHFDNTTEAYSKIKQFMLDNGFEHRQYSGYASKEVMSDSEIASFAEKLNNKFSWLSTCIQEFDVTDIGEQYSLSHIFKTDKTLFQTSDLASLKDNPTQKAKQESQSPATESLKQKIVKLTESKDFKEKYSTDSKDKYQGKER